MARTMSDIIGEMLTMQAFQQANRAPLTTVNYEGMDVPYGIQEMNMPNFGKIITDKRKRDQEIIDARKKKEEEERKRKEEEEAERNRRNGGGAAGDRKATQSAQDPNHINPTLPGDNEAEDIPMFFPNKTKGLSSMENFNVKSSTFQPASVTDMIFNTVRKPPTLKVKTK